LTLVSLPVNQLGPGATTAYWVVCTLLGTAAVGRFYHRQAIAQGVARPPAPYLLTAAGLAVGAFALPAVTSGRLRSVSSAFAVAYLVFAALERSWALAAVAVAMAGIAAATLAADLDGAAVLTWVAIGCLMIVTGLAYRHRATAA